MRLIFNEKIAEKWCLWVSWTVHMCMGALFTRKVNIHSLKKKKKGEKRDVETQETRNPNRTLIKWGDWAILDYNFLHNFYRNLTHNELWVVEVWIHVYSLSSLHHSQLIMWWVMTKVVFLTFLPQNKIGLDLFMLIFNFLIIKKISMSF